MTKWLTHSYTLYRIRILYTLIHQVTDPRYRGCVLVQCINLKAQGYSLYRNCPHPQSEWLNI